MVCIGTGSDGVCNEGVTQSFEANTETEGRESFETNTEREGRESFEANTETEGRESFEANTETEGRESGGERARRGEGG